MQLSFKIETFRIHLFLKMVSGGMKMIKILIVEDELPISKLIEMRFEKVYNKLCQYSQQAVK